MRRDQTSAREGQLITFCYLIVGSTSSAFSHSTVGPNKLDDLVDKLFLFLPFLGNREIILSKTHNRIGSGGARTRSFLRIRRDHKLFYATTGINCQNVSVAKEY